MAEYHDISCYNGSCFAEVKRLIESLRGDPQTRESVHLGKGAQKKRLAELNIHFNPEDVEPLWHEYHDVEKLFESKTIESYLLLNHYQKKYKQQQDTFKNTLSAVNLNTNNEAFNAWRKRNFYRSAGESGVVGKINIHPVFAYELTKGCSGRCWFCALSPDKFGGYWPYSSENARFWKAILAVGRGLFGQSAGVSLLYHATEPFDNPDYLRFLEDFQNINGVLPQTTTAVPFRDLRLTRELMRLRDETHEKYDRFSVLNLKTLREIHRVFSPRELENVRLVLQNRESLNVKAASGRARKHLKKLTQQNSSALNGTMESCAQTDPQKQVHYSTTVECVIGFLVNLPDSSLKLISPCKATDRWPRGYRVHFAAAFRNKDEYKSLLLECINNYMPQNPDPALPLSFRPDLQYSTDENEFILKSPFFEHKMEGKGFFPLLGDAIAGGNKTSGEIVMELVDNGVSYVTAIEYIRLLFEKGLLSDELDNT